MDGVHQLRKPRYMAVFIENTVIDGTSTIDVGLRLLNRFRDLSLGPKPICVVNATYLGHFGAPFLMPAHNRMFETPVQMFETLPETTVSPGAADRWFDTLFDTSRIDKARHINTKMFPELNGWLVVDASGVRSRGQSV